MRRIITSAICGLLLLSTAACGSSSDSQSPASSTTAQSTRPTAAAGATRVAGAAVASATRSPAESTAAAVAPALTNGAGHGVDPAADGTAISSGPGGINGGDDNLPRQVISTIPPPPPGKTPVIDPTTIAEPGAAPAEAANGGDPNALQLAIDLDASTPGIQTARDVAAGDVFRAAVVILNVPAGKEIAAFNFEVDYDKTKIVAPTIAGDESVDRNPDLNQGALGSGWTCLPGPQGDLDDEGGIEGDGVPATGQASLSCFAIEGRKSGTIVLATIEFHAAAVGTSALSLSVVNVGTSAGVEIARCSDSDQIVVPCTGATVRVQ